jgi:DNA-binding response OmpR family regulator
MRILIAEDDEALARFVRQGLEGEHCSVAFFQMANRPGMRQRS